MGKRKVSQAGGRKVGKAASTPTSSSPQQMFTSLVKAYEAGRYEEVVTGANRFTRQWPEHEVGWNLLAESQRMTGNLQEAQAACRKALAINPKSAEAHNNTANAFRDAGDAETAEAEYRKALSLKPGLVEAHFNLGCLFSEQERIKEAASAFRAAVAGRPSQPLYQYRLGVMLGKLENYPDSRSALERAAQLQPGDFDTHMELGRTYRELNEYAKARAEFDKAQALQPASASGYTRLGTALQTLGDFEGADRCGRKALEIAHDYPAAWYLIAYSNQFSASSPEPQKMEKLLEKPELGSYERSSLHFSLGKAYSDIGDDPDLVFSHYRAGCESMRETFDYDISETEQSMEEIAQAFSSTWMLDTPPAGDSTKAPIFVVGMPRSGTTLTEQILSSHPLVHGAGERPDLKYLVLSKDFASGTTFPQWVHGMPETELALLGGHYRSRVIDPAPPVERVVDKMPSNFQYLGLIAKALPNAKVVHLQRDPVDTCLSCYMQRFIRGHRWTYDLEELGRYYQSYAKLMEHWREVLPSGMMLDLSYEELTANPEEQIRRLLDHCGLEWDPACVDFHKTNRSVKTASLSQVRQPMYRSSVAKWRKYRSHLQPLLDALGPLAPADAAGRSG